MRREEEQRIYRRDIISAHILLDLDFHVHPLQHSKNQTSFLKKEGAQLPTPVPLQALDLYMRTQDDRNHLQKASKYTSLILVWLCDNEVNWQSFWLALGGKNVFLYYTLRYICVFMLAVIPCNVKNVNMLIMTTELWSVSVPMTPCVTHYERTPPKFYCIYEHAVKAGGSKISTHQTYASISKT